MTRGRGRFGVGLVDEGLIEVETTWFDVYFSSQGNTVMSNERV